MTGSYVGDPAGYRLHPTVMKYWVHPPADGARGDDTSKLKALVSDWVNCEFKPNLPIDPNDKHSRGFLMIPAASYSTRLNLIEMIQRKQHTRYPAQC